MDIEMLTRFLAWCSVVNIVLFLLWSFFVMVLSEFTFNLQRRFLNISRDFFNAANYAGLGLFKLFIWCFNLTPYLVLQVMN